jgi:pSer/pThr/pTyr-binding forkhead associated (FHA) protein
MGASKGDRRRGWPSRIAIARRLADDGIAFDPAAHYLAMASPAREFVWELRDGWTRIGRSVAADIRLDDNSVSRRHALVVIEPGKGPRILDDRSLGGVLVNGEPVEWTALRDADLIQIGVFTLLYLSPGSPDQPTNEAPGREVSDNPLSLGRVPESWQQAIGPMLPASKIEAERSSGRGGVATATRTAILLFALDREGQTVYPAFQFDEDGTPFLAVEPCLREFLTSGLDPYTTAAWFVTPQRSLEGLTPADWMHGGGTDAVLVEAARRSAALFRR